MKISENPLNLCLSSIETTGLYHKAWLNKLHHTLVSITTVPVEEEKTLEISQY